MSDDIHKNGTPSPVTDTKNYLDKAKNTDAIHEPPDVKGNAVVMVENKPRASLNMTIMILPEKISDNAEMRNVEYLNSHKSPTMTKEDGKAMEATL